MRALNWGIPLLKIDSSLCSRDILGALPQNIPVRTRPKPMPHTGPKGRSRREITGNGAMDFISVHYPQASGFFLSDKAVDF